MPPIPILSVVYAAEGEAEVIEEFGEFWGVGYGI